MILYLAGRALGAEVPMLPHDVPERLPAVRRPAQDVFLRALSERLYEVQPDAPELLRMGEEKLDSLLSGRSSAPPRGATGQQGGLNRMLGVFRGNCHLCETIDFQPVLIIRYGLLLERGNDSLTHECVSIFSEQTQLRARESVLS